MHKLQEQISRKEKGRIKVLPWNKTWFCCCCWCDDPVIASIINSYLSVKIGILAINQIKKNLVSLCVSCWISLFDTTRRILIASSVLNFPLAVLLAPFSILSGCKMPPHTHTHTKSKTNYILMSIFDFCLMLM